MGIYPLFYLCVVAVGWLAGLLRGPIWALLTYVFVYFNIPAQQWWGGQVPSLRWSFIAAGVLLASCFLHREQLNEITFFRNTLGRILLLLLLWMVLIVPFTPNPEHSWIRVYDFFRYVFIFFLIGKVLTDFLQYRLFLGVILFCTFYLSVLAHHYFTGARLDGIGLPDAADANMLAALVVLVLPFYVAAFFTEKGWVRLLPLGAMVFVLNMFVMCSSRGGFVGLALQMCFALPLLRKQVGLVKTLFCCLLVVGCLYRLMSPQYKARLWNLEQEVKSEQEENFGKVSAGRTEIWSYGLQMARDYPLGAGGGAFQALSSRYIPRNLLSGGERASHNTFLLVLVEEGMVGLMLFILFLFVQFRILFRTLRGSRAGPLSAEQKKIVYHIHALLISLAGFWAASFFIDRLYFEGIYLIVALVPVLSRLLGKQDVPVVKEEVA